MYTCNLMYVLPPSLMMPLQRLRIRVACGRGAQRRVRRLRTILTTTNKVLASGSWLEAMSQPGRREAIRRLIGAGIAHASLYA